MKHSNERLIFVGTPDSLEFDEVEALAKMVGNRKIYYTSDSNLLSNLVPAERDRVVPSFLKVDVRSGTYKRYSGRVFQAASLKNFLITSPLNFPELFSSDLLGELIGQGIPILAILQTEFNDTRIAEYLAPVVRYLTSDAVTNTKHDGSGKVHEPPT